MIFSRVLREWEQLPENMKNDSVRKYYDCLYKKRYCLLLKRLFDIFMGVIALIILSPIFLMIAIAIKMDSKGPVMFRQVRITQYGKQFLIFKFRTMVHNAEKIGAQVTVKSDNRITRVGRFLRKYRLDEIPQLLNIISGDMSFVGARPEVVKYVEHYNDEMMATLLLPAGVTTKASIQFKDEDLMLCNCENLDEIYIKCILPQKMQYNLEAIENFNFINEIKLMFKTIMAVLRNND